MLTTLKDQDGQKSDITDKYKYGFLVPNFAKKSVLSRTDLYDAIED
jgi:hypothetical protein